jgi:hypothetical protein
MSSNSMLIMKFLIHGVCLLKDVMNLAVDLFHVLHKRGSFVMLHLLVGCGWSWERNWYLIRSKRLKAETYLKKSVL